MNDLTTKNFGLLIAYVLPGLTILWGISFFYEPVHIWLYTAPENAPTVSGFLYVTLAAVAAGMTASTVRWLLIDGMHHVTGLRRPALDFSRFQNHIEAYDILTEVHYRYYQFYANMIVAILFAIAAQRTALESWLTMPNFAEVSAILVMALFYAGSRDTLGKYYSRLSRLLGTETPALKKGKRLPAEMPSV